MEFNDTYKHLVQLDVVSWTCIIQRGKIETNIGECKI